MILLTVWSHSALTFLIYKQLPTLQGLDLSSLGFPFRDCLPQRRAKKIFWQARKRDQIQTQTLI